MARVQWPLQRDRPGIEIVLTLMQGGKKVSRTVLAGPQCGYDSLAEHY